MIQALTSYAFPLQVGLADLTLPGAGGSQSTQDVFVMHPPDSAIHAIYVQVTDPADGEGILNLQIVQDLGLQGVVALTKPKAFDAAPDGVDMALPIHPVVAGRPIYLRTTWTPLSGTPWWSGANARLLATFHMISNPERGANE